MIAIPFADLSFLPGARGGRKLGDPEVDLRRSCPRGRANEVSIKGFSFDMSSQRILIRFLHSGSRFGLASP
jgi:hypothetical protein